jgi:hypothetical protein
MVKSQTWTKTPWKDRRFFLYDPEGNGLMFFETREERDAAAKEAIPAYAEDGPWAEEVKGVCAGEVTHIATEVDREERPENEEEAEDEGWPSDVDYRCNYELRPLSRGINDPQADLTERRGDGNG